MLVEAGTIVGRVESNFDCEDQDLVEFLDQQRKELRPPQPVKAAPDAVHSWNRALTRWKLFVVMLLSSITATGQIAVNAVTEKANNFLDVNQSDYTYWDLTVTSPECKSEIAKAIDSQRSERYMHLVRDSNNCEAFCKNTAIACMWMELVQPPWTSTSSTLSWFQGVDQCSVKKSFMLTKK